MNELYASEPSVCQTEEELMRLFGYFGPFSGRYLADYPSHWAPLSEAAMAQLGDVARARIKQKVRRAREELRLLPQPTLRWDGGRSWMANVSAHTLATPPILDGIICRDNPPESNGHPVLSELDLPPTAEERIVTSPDEYVRVCRTLILQAPEIHFVDPYLNLNNADVRPVIAALFTVAARGRCKKIVFWARHKEVVRDRKVSVILEDLTAQARSLLHASGLLPDFDFTYNLIDDSHSTQKMHGRYLLTFKGGIRLDQGFKRLGPHHKMDVGPIGKAAFEDIYATYFLRRSDMKIEATFTIREAHRR